MLSHHSLPQLASYPRCTLRSDFGRLLDSNQFCDMVFLVGEVSERVELPWEKKKSHLISWGKGLSQVIPKFLASIFTCKALLQCDFNRGQNK